MHDIKFIRDNPAAFDAALGQRGLPPAAASLLAVDEDRRKLLNETQEQQARKNKIAKDIGDLMRQGKKAEAESLKANMATPEANNSAAEADALETKLQDMLSVIPNMPAGDVPLGKDEKDNTELRKIGTPRLAAGKEHYELGEALGWMDFETAAKLSGARFTMLKGPLARVERALASFMLDMHTEEFGYTEISPPLMVRDEIMYGTAQLPKFAEDQFKTSHGLWLIPTAEVPMTNIVYDSIVDGDALPYRFTAKTPCLRAEAGAAGRDTRGMLRQHQFYKVELVSITRPEQSEAEHERMTNCAEEVLKRLDLPFRTMLLCTGDMGFASRKTYDIEVWLPGQRAYREISSCSNCGDFQARRMKARFRNKGDKATQFVHTLNGSGIAVGRCLIAVMENYQQPDGSIAIPDVLRPYMNGQTTITKAS